jgi:hypothetical protein
VPSTGHPVYESPDWWFAEDAHAISLDPASVSCN